MTTKFKALCSAVGIAAMCATALGQNQATIRSRSNLSVASSANMERIPLSNGLSRQDVRFMKDVAKGHMAEIRLGQIAARRGGSWASQFGRDMVREHTLALEELKQVARKKGVSLPSDVDGKIYRKMATLQRLNGSAFDNRYRMMMLDDHREDLGKVRQEMRTGHDTAVRGYAVTLEPAVAMHLKMVQQKMTMVMGG